MTDLVQKYNVPGPRYTSYPTVPHWDTDKFSTESWTERFVQEINQNKDGISLYIHLPFCESLCTFCGCNKRITKRHDVEEPYIDALLKEWEIYTQLFDERPLINEIHLGGGTPTFFSPKNLNKLILGIIKKSRLNDRYEFSFEGHPNNTTFEHLESLYDIGFNRVSFGVQDYNLAVQKAINRIQPFVNVKRVTETARDIGYESISHDIIFGLPFQELKHIRHTIDKTRELRPDRIAFYSYAHVPWIKGNGQRGFDESNLPPAKLKRVQYETGKKLLSDAGYTEIGMDHFALPHDSLYQAMKNQKLHRNFMGYTTAQSAILIGLGVSAISDCQSAFAQNDKKLENYYELLNQNKLPIVKGHLLSEMDKHLRSLILNLSCRMKAHFDRDLYNPTELKKIDSKLKELEKDGIIYQKNTDIYITEIGRPFIRNVCMVFDKHLMHADNQVKQFSMTI